MAQWVVPGSGAGPVLACSQGLSFWGGVDPETGRVIDAHHDQHGASLAGKVVLMPTSRGSCSGSGVLLELALNGCAPAALVFSEPDEVLTLGAVIATHMFDRPVPVIRLQPEAYAYLSRQDSAQITNDHIAAGDRRFVLSAAGATGLELEPLDQSMLDGSEGPAVQLAMEVLITMAKSQAATRLIDVTSGHIDGCIYHSASNLIFAETMRDMGAKVRIPTTINAISVDHRNWRDQGVAPDFGGKATRLADAYVQMGARPTFTCAPYQSESVPRAGECVGWSESNAVIYANSVLGARTAKHPDYLDLFIAMTGRAPLAGVYLDDARVPCVIIDVDLPERFDDALWPMLGWLAGQIAPDAVPVLNGLKRAAPTADDLRALCAAFGTTSGAPMLHIAGVTPESDGPVACDAPTFRITKEDLRGAWSDFNRGPEHIDLIALGSPHLSLNEVRHFSTVLEAEAGVLQANVVVTLGRDVHDRAEAEGLMDTLRKAGVQVVLDLCWCSITEPVFPASARTLMTNSGKYAHYAPGLSGRAVRFGSLADCARAAKTGKAGRGLPDWLL